MALRGIQPQLIHKRLKVLFYGVAGCGKTTTSIQFPNPYLIDCEKGAENKQYIDIIKKSGGAIFQTSDFNEMIDETKELLTCKHDYKTLIIDPLTVVYDQLLSQAEIKVGSEFGRHFGEANKQMKQLINLLLRLDMNVIITSHSKAIYGDAMKVIGETFDCYKKLDYVFDLVLEIQKRGKDKIIGIVKKTRLENFEDGEQFNFNYHEIANKYGKDILEKNSEIEILATEQQVKELQSLIDVLKIPISVYKKWLEKSNSSHFDEMPSHIIQKCIDALIISLNPKEQINEL